MCVCLWCPGVCADISCLSVPSVLHCPHPVPQPADDQRPHPPLPLSQSDSVVSTRLLLPPPCPIVSLSPPPPPPPGPLAQSSRSCDPGSWSTWWWRCWWVWPGLSCPHGPTLTTQKVGGVGAVTGRKVCPCGCWVFSAHCSDNV